MGKEGIGARVLRKEDNRFITGKGRYTDDINITGQCFATFVRSPHAHAVIKSIDTSKAMKMPGTVGVLNGKELVADKIGNIICGWMIHSKDGSPMNVGAWSALATEKVRYVGDAVALVVARSKSEAVAAAQAVEVEYEQLAPVVLSTEAMNADAAQLHDEAPKNLSFDWELGDEKATKAAFDQAAHVTKLDITNNRVVPNAIEPRAALAHYSDTEDHFTLYTTSQNPHVARLVLSAFYNVAPEHKLRVIAPDVGGGFGSKIYIYPEEIACLWASKKLNVPIKWTAERSESFMTDAHGRDHVTVAEMAFDKNHKITGVRVNTIANVGAYLSLFASATPTYLYGTLLSGQYNIPNVYCNVKAVYTNTVPVDAYRGAGRPEATFVMERLMETSARELNISPVDLRRKNFITEFPHQTPVIMNYDSGNFSELLDKAIAAAKYNEFPARRAEAKARGKLRGIGLSCYIEACGIAPSAAVGSLGAGVGLWESAEIRVNPVGTIEILTGCHTHGQGHETTFPQIVSERIGVPLANISVIHGDTDKTQFGMGTYGSRSGPVGMSAIYRAMEKVEKKAKEIAGHLMEVDPANVEIKNGELSAKGSNKKLAWHEVSLAAYTGHNLPEGMEPGLKESAFYDPLNFTFPSGAYICEVEVEPDTGAVEIIQFVASDDFGRVINPMVVEGQVHGGLAQGIGQAMRELAVYDESGQLITGSYMDYSMPRAMDVPSFKIASTETLCTSNPLGMKGCGEAGAIGSPPAVINAITDAIGNNNLSMPATPQRVWKAIGQ